MQFTKEKFMSFYAVRPSVGASVFYDGVLSALEKFSIASDPVLLNCLATGRTEVGRDYLPVSENLYYSAIRLTKVFPAYFTPQSALAYQNEPEKIANRVYANRMGNGNEKSGDGWRYRGRGYIQLTGKDNYRLYGQILGLDLLNNPDLALDPTVAAQILVAYFKNRNILGFCTASFKDTPAYYPNLKEVRRLVNGGANGLPEFAGYFFDFKSKII
jgi:predicted chitinase